MRRGPVVATLLSLVLAGCSPVGIVPLEEQGAATSAGGSAVQGHTQDERMSQRMGQDVPEQEGEGEHAAQRGGSSTSVLKQNEEAIRKGLAAELDLMVAPDARAAASITARLDETSRTSLATYGTDTAELLSHLLAHFSYRIDSVDVASKTAVAHIAVQNVDLQAALDAASQSMTSGEGAKRLEEAYATGDETQIMRAATEIVYEAIDAAPVVERSLDLSLYREGDTWQLSAESQATLVSSVLGGSVEVPLS